MKFCWTTINVKDMAQSVRFYQEIIGLEVTKKMNPSPDMELAFLGSGETQVELICHAKNQDARYGKDISLGFVVESIESITELLTAKNIAIIAGPFQPNPFIKFIYVLDPNGLKIQFVENIK
jgi:lactoylglutathione lyase